MILIDIIKSNPSDCYRYYLGYISKFQDSISASPPLFSYSRHNSPTFALKCSCPSKSPVKIQYVVDKAGQKQVSLVGKKANMPRLGPLKMQRKDAKNPFHLSPDARKNPVPPLLSWRKRSALASLGRDVTKSIFFAVSLSHFLFVVCLVGENGRSVAFKEFVKDLRIVDVDRGTDKLGQKLIFGINGYVILVAIYGFFALYGEGSIVILAGTSCGLNRPGIDDFSGAKFEALLSELAFELLKTFAPEVHGLKVGSELGDGRVIGCGVNKGFQLMSLLMREISYERKE